MKESNNWKILINDFSKYGMSAASALTSGCLIQVIRNLSLYTSIKEIWRNFDIKFVQMNESAGNLSKDKVFYLWKNTFLGIRPTSKNSVRGSNQIFLYALLGIEFIDSEIIKLLNSNNESTAYENAVVMIQNLFLGCLNKINVLISENNLNQYFNKMNELQNNGA